jgi:nicotinamidase-related amidase
MANELPVPDHFDPLNATKLMNIDYQSLYTKAKNWARIHSLQPASTDILKTCLMVIDCQNSFCIPTGQLYVAGAENDSNRLCEFIYKNLGMITDIIPTMDTHLAMQIFYSPFWIDENGNNPEPGTTISTNDVKSGRWKVNPVMAINYIDLQQYALHYVKKLLYNNKHDLFIWPFHSMIGGVGHALVGSIEEALFFHSVARNSQICFEIKGKNPLTENYSVLSPEVLEDHMGLPIDQKNSSLIKKLLSYDIVIVAGQAKSHCVAWTIQDLLDEINVKDPSLVSKIYLLEDCTSPVIISGVVDFTDQANETFKKFSDAGMNIVESTDPITNWKGMK